jgi:hypothetical protein
MKVRVDAKRDDRIEPWIGVRFIGVLLAKLGDSIDSAAGRGYKRVDRFRLPCDQRQLVDALPRIFLLAVVALLPIGLVGVAQGVTRR